jgi:Bardet-Biedl syndrome 9 protein
MSVFKAREWWATRTGDGEESDGAQLAVGNVDNASDGVQKAVVGSYKGVLRIYRPSAKDFRASDMVLEAELGAPILGVEIGVFGSASQKDLMLAVLHPRRLVVYSAASTKVQSEHVRPPAPARMPDLELMARI